jgi:hypothetical protein
MMSRQEHSRDDYVPVLFTTHTQPAGVPRRLVQRRVEEYFQHLSNYTGTHILAVRGIETVGNIHEHARVEVHKKDLLRFYKRYPSFRSSQVPNSKWKELDQLRDDEQGYWVMQAQPFDLKKEVDAYRYILVKHEPVLPDDSKDYFCPRKLHQCKKGNCRYIPANK